MVDNELLINELCVKYFRNENGFSESVIIIISRTKKSKINRISAI